MPEPDKFEDDLLYALTRTGEGFRTGQADLVAGGYRRGRSRWRRRSAAAVVSGAAALALVGTGAVYLAGPPAAKDAGTVSAASGPATAPGGGSPAATPTTVRSSAPTVVTGDEVLATFQALLPKGETTEAKGHGTDDDRTKGTFVGADLVFDDGQGKSLVQLGIQKHRPGQGQPRTCPTDLELARIDSCAVTTLPDGSRLQLLQGYEYSDGRAGTKEWSAALSGPDGREITVSEWNAAQEKGAPDSRPAPPLTLDQLRAVVTDRSWDRVVAAVKAEGIDTQAADPGLSLEAREAALVPLLPPGVTVTGRTGEALYATFQLARGQNTGSLVLQVQNWSKLVDNPWAQAFKDALTRPDGTKVLTRGGTDTKEKMPPTVSVLRPDGMEVSVSQGPTGTALLTREQLEAIAVSPVWRAEK